MYSHLPSLAGHGGSHALAVEDGLADVARKGPPLRALDMDLAHLADGVLEVSALGGVVDVGNVVLAAEPPAVALLLQGVELGFEGDTSGGEGNGDRVIVSSFLVFQDDPSTLLPSVVVM